MSSDLREPHEVLDVPRGADRQQVIRAFRRKVRRGGHPDTGGDARVFEEIVHARDVLLARPQPDVQEPDLDKDGAATPQAQTVPNDDPYPEHVPPKQTHKLAIVTVVLAALGPLFWPFAIAVGHLALRQIKRTGLGGGTVVPVVLLLLYVLTLPILARVLSIVLIP